jgi:predicted  nucleic acid-binding Zn-ribbon protein
LARTAEQHIKAIVGDLIAEIAILKSRIDELEDDLAKKNAQLEQQRSLIDELQSAHAGTNGREVRWRQEGI